MNKVLQFPSKVFVQWGAIAQEIVPCLAQRGAGREEICAVIDRLRTRWEQAESVSPASGTASELPGTPESGGPSESMHERDLYVSRHWRSQPARTLIESAMADYQRHAPR